MKSTDRTILVALVAVGLVAAFWFLAISPKRAAVSELDSEISGLEASVAEQEQLVALGDEAKATYKGDYHALVVLGKAVPGDADAASLIDQTQTLADRSGVDFRSIVLGTSGAATSEAPPPAPAPPPTDPAATSEAATAASEGATASAPATEAAASLLPIGATVGPAGLPVMPYNLSFRGDFFQVADFMARLDGLVRTKSKGIGVDGRLLTVDGFVLGGDQARGFPYLDVEMSVTSYVAPADQGIAGGATAETPAAVAPAAETVSSAPTPTATATAP